MKPIQLATLLFAALSITACTGQIPNSFRFAQQNEYFNANLAINTKIDLLWVVDNSASMDMEQARLRSGFTAFANKYMQPTWDIRVAVITTDTYLANSAFSGYLNSTLAGTVGYSSPYINSRIGTWSNPPSNPTLYDLNPASPTYRRFPSGVKMKDLVPAWGPNYARLLAGVHDGPVSAFCFEGMGYFMRGATQCQIRDNPANANYHTGNNNCLTPAGGESGVTQCVNTTQNDSVRSGKPIISTFGQNPAQLARDFIINVTAGTSGNGSERGMQSVLQFMTDNEVSGTAFFRPGSIRGIFFVSDEEDQSQVIPSSVPAGYGPWSGYKCDQASLIANNPTANITGANGYCCSNPANNCSYGSNGTSCSSKTVDGHTYTIGICPDDSKLIPVSEVKGQMDDFFHNLDGSNSAPTNYFIASIVALSGAAIQSLQANRDIDDSAVGALKMATIDRADRYIELGNAVGNGSMTLDISSADYGPLLDAIGRAITKKVSTFALARIPTGSEDMIVAVVHADGSRTIVQPSQYLINGNELTITDLDLVLSFKSTDRVNVDYQPKTEVN